MDRNIEYKLSSIIIHYLIQQIEISYHFTFNEENCGNLFKRISYSDVDNHILTFNYKIETFLLEIYNRYSNKVFDADPNDGNNDYTDRINQSLMLCECIIDYLWERLNTKKWSEVSISIRQLYAYHNWLKALLILSKIYTKQYTVILSLLTNALHCIDTGLIMSPDLCNKLLAKSATLLHEILIILLDNLDNTDNFSILIEWRNLIHQANNYRLFAFPSPPLNPLYKIDEIQSEEFSLLEFENEYLRKNIPFIIRKYTSHWPCMAMDERRWNFPYLLRRMAFRAVPVELGSKYTDDNWSQKIISVKEFVEKFIFNRSNGIGYMAQYNLFDSIIELFSDIDIPSYCAIGDPNEEQSTDNSDSFEINAWFGPAGTVSPLHFDAKHNLFVQIMGSKYIRMYSSETSCQQIYPNEKDSLLWNTSRINLENIDWEKFPEFKNINSKLIFECILNEGDLLFIPKKFWHFIKATSDSFSINFWWT